MYLSPFLSPMDIHFYLANCIDCLNGCDYCRGLVIHIHCEQPGDGSIWNIFAHMEPDKDDFCTFWRRVGGGARL